MKVLQGIVFSVVAVLFLMNGNSVVLAADTSAYDTNIEVTDDNQTITDYITDYEAGMSYDDIQEVLDGAMGTENSIQFEEYVKDLVSGKEKFSFQAIFQKIISGITAEWSLSKGNVIRLISIAIIAAIFTNFTTIFENNQVAETGFYITYLLLFTVLASSFYAASRIAATAISLLLDFMKALVPTYVISLTFASGVSTSTFFYEATLVIITIVDFILLKFILPMINVYFILVLANNLSKEDMLSKLAELLQLIIGWTLKTLFGTVIGFNVIQGLILPVSDYVKNSLIVRAGSAIPGIGGAFGGVTQTILGAGVLIKNAIGVAGLIIIVIICAVPIAKLFFYVLLYKFGVAIVQPISDKRIMNCMNASADAARLLLHSILIGAVLFLFTIAIITTSTNLRLAG